MKRLCRWLFNLVAWTSFLLFVFTIAAWVFSYWRIYSVSKQSASSSLESAIYHDEWDYWCAVLIRGHLVFFVGTNRDSNPPASFSLLGGTSDASNYTDVPPSGYLSRWRVLGFEVGQFLILNHVGQHASGSKVGIPLWFVAFVAVIPSAFWFKSRRAPQNGLCEVCGYDLRATPERCPECGTVPIRPS